jgi:myo-inositol-1(or 4)-monophosphatase
MNNNYKDVAIALALEAGEIIRKNFTLNMQKEWKHDHSPVTETDLQINKIVIDTIKKNFPDHNVLSEEGSDLTKESEYVWVCDPVDGTHTFSHGIPCFAFTLALVHKGLPILGIIYDPMLDRTFFAEKGKGATLNGEPIHVSKSASLGRTVVGLGKWEDVCNLFPVAKELRDNNVRLVTGLSISYMGALVAAGELSATLYGSKSIYDVVATKIIVEEAGGKSTDLFGGMEASEGDVKGQLATNGLVHDEILAIIKKHTDAI